MPLCFSKTGTTTHDTDRELAALLGEIQDMQVRLQDCGARQAHRGNAFFTMKLLLL